MMINTVTNTAIVNKSYVSRGLITHGAATNNVVRQNDGTLWVAVRESHTRGDINLYRSSDSGFSWENVFRGSWPTGLGWGFEETVRDQGRANGPFISLNVLEHLNRIILWHSFRMTQQDEVRLWPFLFDLTTGERITEEPDAPPSNAEYYQVDADDINVKVVYNDNTIYMVYIRNQAIRVRTFDSNLITVNEDDRLAGLGYVDFDANARVDGEVDLALVTQNEDLLYRRYDERTGNFTSENTIATNQTYIQDLNIVRNGEGTLLATWGDSGVIRYATSTNNGGSWSVNNIPASGWPYIDNITNETAARVNALAGLEGFLISYARLGTAGSVRSYVRTLEDGTLGEEREIAAVSHPFEDVVGAKFFDTPAGKFIDLSEPGWARVAYQVGEGNSATGEDTTPVRFGQEELVESAYDQSSSDTAPTETPLENQVLISMKVLPGPSSNVDYYAEGAVGRHTHKAIASFNRAGTNVRILRYNPTREAEVNDRSGFGVPEEQVVPAIITPMTYDTPFAATQDDFTTFIERDVRKIHIPPTLHLEREFILNNGNYLKRTVWTVYFGGNEYEISQVVPSFVHGQISHYSANIYVIGPSNDPFSRKTLPSET